MFFLDDEEIDKFCCSLKHSECPFCHKIGKLNKHGFLRGYSETSSGRVVRGRRVFCNNRKKSTGCGKTFSLVMLYFIKGFMVSTTTLSKVLLRFFEGKSLTFIAKEVLSSFSERYVYGLFSRIRLRQPFIRERLLKLSNPEETGSPDPLFLTILHLKSLFPETNVVAAFQQRFQASFL